MSGEHAARSANSEQGLDQNGDPITPLDKALFDYYDGQYDSTYADKPQCPFVGQNYAGERERCLRREGHPGDHMGMGSD